MKSMKFWMQAGLLVLTCGWIFVGCSSDDNENESSKKGIVFPSNNCTVTRCQVLQIEPQITDGENYDFVWSIGDSILSEKRELDFISLETGTYDVKVAVSLKGKEVLTKVISITVQKESKEYSPYITSVFDYMPAPGQFVNTLPEYETGDTQETMNRKVLEAIGNNMRGMISLGGFGGYVVVGFNHTIVNVPGEYDFQVIGNSFEGSSEPGIVEVAYDKNGNGKPDDDEWYELAGSDFSKSGTTKNYSITYVRPDESKTAVPGPQFWQTDTQYIAWSDNGGASGYLTRNSFHSQSYYPLWVDKDKLVFTGTRLPDNGVNTGTDEDPYWYQTAYSWGYADNVPNTSDASKMKIDWAVDKTGKSVSLPGIDFVRIYTGIRQECGWLGENSTEICGVTDLHLQKNAKE